MTLRPPRVLLGDHKQNRSRITSWYTFRIVRFWLGYYRSPPVTSTAATVTLKYPRDFESSYSLLEYRQEGRYERLDNHYKTTRYPSMDRCKYAYIREICKHFPSNLTPYEPPDLVSFAAIYFMKIEALSLMERYQQTPQIVACEIGHHSTPCAVKSQ